MGLKTTFILNITMAYLTGMTEVSAQLLIPPRVSIVVPVFNSKGTLPELVRQVQMALGDQCCELLLVDDASQDESWEVILSIVAENKFVHGIQLMQNAGQHAALIAGIRATSGDIIVTLDDDLQHPPFEIPKLLEALVQNVDLVYGVPKKVNQTTSRKLSSDLARFFLRKFLGVRHAYSYTSFRAFRSSIKIGFEGYVGDRPSIDPLLLWVTNRISFVSVEHHRRISGTSNYTFRSLYKFFEETVLSYSKSPLRISLRLGFLISSVSLLTAIFLIVRVLMFGSIVPGFAFLATSITFFAGLQVAFIGVLGAYIGKIHFRSMNKPTYTVRTRTN